MFLRLWMGFIFFTLRALLSLRYKIRFEGFSGLAAGKPNSILFLPNHPSELDPVMVMLTFWRRFRPRPLVVEHFYKLKGFQWLMKLVGAFPIPDLNGSGNKWKQVQVEHVFNEIAGRLKEGENFLIYPSGRLKSAEEEVIGGASFVHSLLKACPECQVVLVKTSGLWGSRFSRAITGKSPKFGKVLLEGLKSTLMNGIFFLPRREVVLKAELAPADFPSRGSRLEVNRYLEAWYNRGGDPLKVVSDRFWKEHVPEVYKPKSAPRYVGELDIAPGTEFEIFSKIAEMTKRPVGEINRSLFFAKDLGFDSLDTEELYTFLDSRYSLEGIIASQLQTVEDVLRAASGLLKPLEKEEEKEEVSHWPREKKRKAIGEPRGETIPEAFLRLCDEMGGRVAAADSLSGVLTYRKLKMSALILSRKIRQLEGEYIGILLPASVGVYVIILATLLAGKIPVMLNWTVGSRALDHCLTATGLKVVLSSERFLNNLSNADLGEVETKLLFLEKIRSEISLKDKLRGFWEGLKGADSLLKRLKLDRLSPEAPAVILFTSGTESLPKGVPLTHANILSNQRAALSCIDLKPDDILYGVLPPFHSFGFVVTGLLPLLSGFRVFFAPDPTDGKGMGRDIATWKITLFCCAPTFIKGMLRVAKPSQLQSLRYIVSGAEKTPQDIFDTFGKMGKEVLEGYGITECSPVVSLTRPGKEPKEGVGEPIPGITIRIVSEAGEVAPQGAEGEICIFGPGVFHGYLGVVRDPFIEIEGKRFYRSGDLGKVSESGALLLSGRLKRFTKIGAEMVSLGGIEEEVMKAAYEKGWIHPGEVEGPAVAACSLEREGEKPLIVLFSAFDLSKESVNEALRDSGHGRIVKVAEVRRVDKIPLTGTGKTHYRSLNEMLA